MNLHPRTRSRPDRPQVVVGVVLVLLALMLPACAGDGAEDIQAVAEGEAGSAAELPEWIEKLYPPPGAEAAINQALQVNHNVIAADQQVRLSIDGTDVTAYATANSPGLLEYDIDQPTAPIELGPGEHEATVELVRVTPGASEGVDSYDPQVHETIESYTWSFTLL